MGGFYGSVQVRSDDLQAVKSVAEEVARGKGVKCYLGPALRGWIGIYPENNGQDQSFGEAVAERLQNDVLHVLVHDDDVLAYWLWRDGALLDSYWSTPGYFGEEGRAEQEAMAGRPELFGALLPQGPEPLRDLLRRDRDDFVFAAERLEQFAKLLDIPNAVTAYEYLQQGETEGIAGWKRFRELPAAELAKEKESARERRKQLTAWKKKLKASGLLLTDVVAKVGGIRACAAGAGFAVVRSQAEYPGVEQDAYLELYHRPWAEPQEMRLDMNPQVNHLTCSATRHRAAAVLGKRVVVWNVPEWSVQCTASENDWAINAALSDDGQLLAHSSREEVVVSNATTGARVCCIPKDEARKLAFHPSGRFLIAVLHDGLGIAAVDQRPEAFWKRLQIGGKKRLLPQEILQRLQFFSPEEAERQIHAMMEVPWEKAKEAIDASGGRISAEQMAQVNERIKEITEKIQQEFRDCAAGALPPEPEPYEWLANVKFTRDGQWLCCGTARGFRVYPWEAVCSASLEMPPPTWRYDTVPAADVFQTNGGHVYAIAEEVAGDGVLFGGADGRLFRMDLTSGAVRHLLTMPDEAAILAVTMSQDGQAVGIVSVPSLKDFKQARNDRRAFWNIWSYPQLLAGGEQVDTNR